MQGVATLLEHIQRMKSAPDATQETRELVTKLLDLVLEILWVEERMAEYETQRRKIFG